MHGIQPSDLLSPAAAPPLHSEMMASNGSEQPNSITFGVANTSDGPKSEQEIGFVDEEAPPVCFCSKLVHCLMFVGRYCNVGFLLWLLQHALLLHLLDLHCSRDLCWVCGSMPDCAGLLLYALLPALLLKLQRWLESW